MRQIVEINRRYRLAFTNGDNIKRAVGRVATMSDRLSPATEPPVTLEGQFGKQRCHLSQQSV